MGKSVWLGDEVLGEVAERSRGNESPNQTLRRVLLDDDNATVSKMGMSEDEVRQIARDEADDLITEYKNEYR